MALPSLAPGEPKILRQDNLGWSALIGETDLVNIDDVMQDD